MKKTIVITAKQSYWEQAKVEGGYEQSTIDSTLADVGFIHCSFPDQAMDIINRKYADQDDLIFLLVDPAKVKAEIKYEAARSGRAGTFPHVYGPLNVDAVYAEVPLRKDAAGKFITPAALSQSYEQSKKYQYVLLDWDGNLAKTLDVWLAACRVALEKRGLKLSDEDIAGSFGHLRTTWEPWGIKDIDAAIEEADIIARKDLPNVELYPDALEVLEALHMAGKKLALITSSERVHIQQLLERYNIDQLFTVVITGEDVKNHKPHAEPIEKALNTLGGTKSEAIMIGDSDKDLGAANNAGVDSILFYPPEHRKFYDRDTLTQLNPTYIVDDFRQILEIV